MATGLILIVEDDPDILDSLQECLEQAGHDVETAANGAIALLRLEGPPRPDLVLLDMNMPIMNGDQLLDAIFARPELRSIPVIQMSAAGSRKKRDGVVALLSKPFHVSSLLDAIEGILSSACCEPK